MIAAEFNSRVRKLINAKKAKIALFIGRFQPFHKAHLSDIKLALKECDKVVIAIGSSQESGTRSNPFSYKERKEMIEKVMNAHKITRYNIMPVPDVNDDEKWVEHVRKLVPELDVVYTGNDLTQKLFKERKFKVKKIELIPNISATEIRKRILHDGNWRDIVPEEVAEYIRKIYGADRIKGINNHK